jgi:hypothetical protein
MDSVAQQGKHSASCNVLPKTPPKLYEYTPLFRHDLSKESRIRNGNKRINVFIGKLPNPPYKRKAQGSILTTCYLSLEKKYTKVLNIGIMYIDQGKS